MNSHLIPAVAAFIKKHGEKTLRAGDTISYNHPVLNHLISNVFVIAVDTKAECYPLKLDTSELLPYTHHIIVEKGPKRQRRSIRSHTLVEGKVNAPTRRDKFAAAVRNISSEVFASAKGNHAPSQDSEYHNTQEENVCIPNDIAAKILSPVQPEIEVCQTGGMEDIPSAERSGVTSQEDMDIRDHIPPVLIYESPEEAKRLMNSFARQHGYALVVADTQRDRNKVKYRVVFACDRHGTYKPKPKPSVDVKHRVNTATRKCGCPLRINLYLNRSSLK
ncbi:hypothetical protein DVH05_000880 [Phytophthora capsici]|nr:hypothetical protein DVH05_000880 [Phytophthora capsici]